jgi:AI-2 transport protein TqsA
MQTMTIRGFPILRFLLGAAAIVIVVFGLKFSSDVLAPIFFAATLAVLFSPLLRWLEKKGLPTGLALLAMILGLGGFIVCMVIILTVSMKQLAQRLPFYQALLHQRIDTLGTVLGNSGIDLPTGCATRLRQEAIVDESAP